MLEPSKNTRWRNLGVFTLLTLIIVGTLGIFTLTYMVAEGTIHPKRLAVNQTSADYDISEWREVSFMTSDGLRLEGWFILPEVGQGTVLFVHGHAANREQFIREAMMLHEQGYGALLFDLRNSGRSDGDQTTLGYDEAEDVVTAYAFLTEQAEVTQGKIVIYGHSMGGASAIMATPQLTDVAGLIIDATFTSVETNTHDLVRQILPFSSPIAEFALWVMENGTGADFYAVRPIDIMPTLATPLLVLHGTADPTIPIEHGQILFSTAQNPYDFVQFEGAGHGGLFAHSPDLYERTLLDFLELVFEG